MLNQIILISSPFLFSCASPFSLFSDRLGELERDKARLSQQLIAQQREHLAREMDFYKKSKSKNLLKRGFKKLKGKIQVYQMKIRRCLHAIQNLWHVLVT